VVLGRTDNDGNLLLEAKDALIGKIDEVKAEGTAILLEIIRKHEQIDKLSEQVAELGGKKNVAKELNILREQRDKISKDLKFNEEDINNYEAALASIETHSETKRRIEEEIATIQGVSVVVEDNNAFIELSHDTQTRVKTIVDEIVAKATETWALRKVEIINQLNKELTECEVKLTESEEVRNRLKGTIEGNNAIKELAGRINIESNKLKAIENLEAGMVEATKSRDAHIESVAKSHIGFSDEYTAFARYVNNNTVDANPDLSYLVKTPFRQEEFVAKWMEVFGVKRNNSRELVNTNTFDETQYTVDFLISVIRKTLSGELEPLKNLTQEQALRNILDDWYNIKYEVKMGDDVIEKMSPGKKALVLLKLLVELAESQCPILIDQPEDDLDSRSVFDQLIPFISRKKIERQIIIVTHSANIVLGADAEEVIVANQDGIGSEKKSKKFEYRSGSIENDYPIYKADGVTKEDGILNERGIQQHICDVLEGGIKAFEKRRNKYQYMSQLQK
jgi:hypothetical protein